MRLAPRSLSPHCGGESEIEGFGERKPAKLQISEVRGSVPLSTTRKNRRPFGRRFIIQCGGSVYFAAVAGAAGWRTWRHSFSRRCRTWAGIVAGAAVLVEVFVCMSSLLGFGSLASKRVCRLKVPQR